MLLHTWHGSKVHQQGRGPLTRNLVCAQDNGFAVNGQVRRIPFEVMVRGDKAPVYEETLEDLGRFNDQPALPFNAYGTMALARGEFEANSGSSQVFWLLKACPCILSSRLNVACNTYATSPSQTHPAPQHAAASLRPTLAPVRSSNCSRRVPWSHSSP